MKRIGITGGIGAGKTTITNLFREYFDVPVFISDIQNALMLNGSAEIRGEIADAFGWHIIDDDDLIDRKILGDIVFKDKEKLKVLGEIIKPHLIKRFDKWCKVREDIHDYCLFESAIIVENDFVDKFDALIVVTADKEVRLNRARLRDNTTVEDIENRMNNQLPQEELLKHADYVIDNSGAIQIDDIHEQILST